MGKHCQASYPVWRQVLFCLMELPGNHAKWSGKYFVPKIRVPAAKEIFVFKIRERAKKYFFSRSGKSRNFVNGLTVKFENGAKFREFCI